MSGYEETMFELELRVARAQADGDLEERNYVAKMLRDKGDIPCVVCGTMIRFHHLEGWQHSETGLDHRARPDRSGFEWPAELDQPGTRPGSRPGTW